MIFESVDKWIEYQERKLESTFLPIVTTNGCFDLFINPAHLDVLERARSHGKLVVLVNTDESVKKLKGEDRPIIPLQNRMMILNAIQWVDYVMPMTGDDPLVDLEKIRPDVHVKGGDYPKNIIERTVMERHGKRTIIMPFVKTESTTELIQRIRQKG